MPSEAGGARIVADGPHLVAERRCARSMNQTTSAAAIASRKPACSRLPCTSFGSAASGDHLRRLRPAQPHRVLERPVQQQADEQHDDEVEQQRRHHLVDAEAVLQQRRAQQASARRRCAPASSRIGISSGAGSGNKPVPSTTVDDGADIELALAADVPQLGAEGDGGGKAGEDQRRRARQRLEQGELRAGRALEHQREGTERARRRSSITSSAAMASVTASAPSGASTMDGKRGARARFKPHAASRSMPCPAIISPSRSMAMLGRAPSAPTGARDA